MATIVFDADGTLWDGIILYQEPVTLRPGTLEVLKEISKRGHRLVCCSKNNIGNLDKVLTQFGLRPYFKRVIAAFELPKSEMFKDFYVEGDPTLFIDDDPFQRDEVKHAFPNVATEFFVDPLDVLNHPFVARSESPEDRKRADLIRAQRARELAQDGYSANFQEFLKKSELVLKFQSPLPESMYPRALDLLNRTNELKLTKERYKKVPLFPRGWLYGAELRDVYGEYGLIAVGVVDSDSLSNLFLKDLAVSCRTIGRGVGTAMVVRLCRLAKAVGTGVQGMVETTNENHRMQPLFEYLKFQKKVDLWVWTPMVDPTPEYPDWLEVINP